MNPEILEKVMSCKSLPSLPAVALRVIELTQDNKVRAAELASTITNDQGLSAKLLRTVNSSFYALRKPCTTIQGAIVMLGFNAVKTLALGFSLVGAIAEGRDKGFDYNAYWRRSLLSGVAAKCFARACETHLEEESFLGGLLQDIGMIAMYRAMGDEYQRILALAGDDHRQLMRYETSELEITHCDIGSMLAQRWKLPAALAIPIKFHERPSAAPSDVIDICKAVGLGNIAAELLTTSEPGVVLKRLYTKALELGGLQAGQVDDIMKSVQQGAKEVAHLLNLDIGAVPDSQEVLAQANKQLAAITVPFAKSHQGDAGPDIDDETGLPSRLIFNRNLVTGFDQSQAVGRPLTIAILMIDDFPDITQQHGDTYASELVRMVGESLRQHFAADTQLVCRYDTHRFAIIMADTDRLTATRIIDGARARICIAPVVCRPPGLVASEIAISLSVGLCTLDQSTTARVTSADDMVDITMKALDAAVRAGGGCVRAFTPRAAA